MAKSRKRSQAAKRAHAAKKAIAEIVFGPAGPSLGSGIRLFKRGEKRGKRVGKCLYGEVAMPGFRFAKSGCSIPISCRRRGKWSFFRAGCGEGKARSTKYGGFCCASKRLGRHKA